MCNLEMECIQILRKQTRLFCSYPYVANYSIASISVVMGLSQLFIQPICLTLKVTVDAV